MWQLFGDAPFVLAPKHAALFREVVASLSDELGWDDEEQYEFGSAAFDELSQGQKQAAILMVSKALLDPSVEPPTVTAALAATVDAIYGQLEARIETEMAIGEWTTIREMVLATMEETNYWNEVNDGLPPSEKPEVRPAPTSTDDDAWSLMIECLRSELLEDRDFGMADKFLDMPPDQAAALKQQMNIAQDYFTAVIEDPTPARLAEIERELQGLLNPVQRI